MAPTEQLSYPAVDLDEIESSAIWIESHPITRIRIDLLVLEDSPRLEGEDKDHVMLLAKAGDSLPPITVHRPTLRVIDGVHRVRAALLNGATDIAARLLDCDKAAAFVLSVTANITHGLSLSRADRVAAAARIIRTHPHWSDRVVTAATGISDKTVSRIRLRLSPVESTQSSTRLGRDGRVRPLNSGQHRRRAAALLLDRPDASLREVARATGLSPTTVRDVRQRIHRGEDPVPGRYRNKGDAERPLAMTNLQRTPDAADIAQGVDRQKLLARLSEDPSLRLNEAGRRVLRWLHHYSVGTDGIETLERGVPCHWAPEVADLARSCAAAWNELAAQLQRRAA